MTKICDDASREREAHSAVWSGDHDLSVEEWGPAIAALTTRFDVRPDSTSDFHGRLRAHVADGIGLCDLETGKHEAYHDPAGRDGATPVHMLSLQLNGHATMEVDGQQCVFRPGDIGFYSADRVGLVASSDDYRSLCLTLPSNAISIPVDYIRHVQARTLGPERGLTPAVAGLLISLNETLPKVGPAQRSRALRSAVDLAVTLVLQEVGESVIPKDPTQRLREQLFAYIEDHLDDPELDVKQLADAHYVSVRQVHNVFRGAGQTAAERIRTRRIELAQRELADPAQLTVPVGQIAMRCGFANPSHFGNLFKERIGVTPAAYRASVHPGLG